MRTACQALVFAITTLPAVAAGQGDAERGEALFRKCAACHEVGDGAKNRVGPHLNGVFGRQAGTLDGFRYSPAMVQAGVDGLVWDADTLVAFVADPKSVVARTRMSFPGLGDTEDQADVLAFLQRFSDQSDTGASGNLIQDLDPAILAIEGDPEYGAYLSSECTTCHQADGEDRGIPSITGWPEEEFVAVMHAYRTGGREHPVMNMVAGRLGDEDIAALAAYFAQPDK